MDETERLTSYLDGGLAADERRALEAELDGDSALRARLEALRAADEALGLLPPTAPPDGARQRLDARLAGVLEEVLAADPAAPVPLAAPEVAKVAPTTAEAAELVPDELAARRRWRVLPALTGVAAGLALLAGGVIGLGQTGLLSGGDDQLASGGAEADMSVESAPAPTEDALAPGGPDGPVVIDDGRSATASELDRLLTSPELEALAARALPAGEGEALAAQLQQQLLGDLGGAEAAGSPTDGEETAQDALEEDAADDAADEAGDEAGPDMERAEAPAAGPVIIARDGQALSPADAAAVRRCLAVLLEAGTQAIPTTIELLDVDGVAAIAFGLVTLDPATDAFTRSEVWTLDRADCQVVRFTQS